jgi:choline dehydrogenase-like flavoprotein
MNLNVEAEKNNTYDAIVVGTGISGGWAAKELTEKGLKTLVLERGRMVKASRLSHSNKRSLGFRKCWKTDTRRSETTRSSGAHHLHYSPRDKTLVCK